MEDHSHGPVIHPRLPSRHRARLPGLNAIKNEGSVREQGRNIAEK